MIRGSNPGGGRDLINGTMFEKKVLNIKCVLIFSTILPETFLILRRNEGDMMKKCTLVSMRYTLFLADFNET